MWLDVWHLIEQPWWNSGFHDHRCCIPWIPVRCISACTCSIKGQIKVIGMKCAFLVMFFYILCDVLLHPLRCFFTSFVRWSLSASALDLFIDKWIILSTLRLKQVSLFLFLLEAGLNIVVTVCVQQFSQMILPRATNKRSAKCESARVVVVNKEPF